MRGLPFDNYLTAANGCAVSQVSSERKGTHAGNILLDNPKALWVISQPLPQHCILDLRDILAKPTCYNKVGFYCWHEYNSNPSLIELTYRLESDAWVTVAKIRLSITSEWQYFKIKEIPSTAKFLKIVIHENFGDSITFLNQVALGYAAAGQLPMGQTTSSAVEGNPRLTSTQKQVRRAQEHIQQLTSENSEMKETISVQRTTIGELQDTIRRLDRKVEAMRQIQQLQAKKIAVLESRSGVYSKQTKRSATLRNNRHAAGSTDQDKLRQHGESISEFEHSDEVLETRNSKVSKTQSRRSDCSSMLEKLQHLLFLREQKKRQLRNKSPEDD